MGKKVLIISTGLRKNGNSDLLAQPFARGAEEDEEKCERAIIRVLLTALITLALCFCIPVGQASAESGTKVKVKVGSKSFNAVFYDNDTSKALLKSMPVKLKMSELNGNEKYKYLNKDFPTNEKRVKRVKAGDIMLYGSDCLVVFYKSFNTSYEYTKVGRITNPKGLKKAEPAVLDQICERITKLNIPCTASY